VRKKIAILVLTIAAAVPSASLAKGPNFECPGGPPGHCKTGGGQSQSQQQQQSQEQHQCLIVLGLLQPATC
jgi:hypothetical protein